MPLSRRLVAILAMSLLSACVTGTITPCDELAGRVALPATPPPPPGTDRPCASSGFAVLIGTESGAVTSIRLLDTRVDLLWELPE